MPSSAASSISILVLAALFLGMLIQGFLGIRQIVSGENVSMGSLDLLSVPLLILLVYLFLRWFRLNQIKFDLNAMIFLTFGLYALSYLFGIANGVAAIFINTSSFSVVDQLFYACNYGLRLIFYSSLFMLTASMLKKPELKGGNLQLMTLSLLSYGLLDVVGVFRAIYLTNLGRSVSSWTTWVGAIIEASVFLFLSAEAFKRRELRRTSIYATFLLLAASMLFVMQTSSNSLQNIIGYLGTAVSTIFRPRFNPISFFSLMSGSVSLFAQYLSLSMVVWVSISLLRGKQLRNRLFKLSLAAIILYALSELINPAWSTAVESYSFVSNPATILTGTALPRRLLELPYAISLLTIGLILYKERSRWINTAPTIESRNHGAQ